MNLGYACINMNLSTLPKSKRVTTNRSMIKKTFQQKGIAYASELGLQNAQDLLKILQWNEEHGIKFFRMSSDIFPWSSEYNLKDLPDYEDIAWWLDQWHVRLEARTPYYNPPRTIQRFGFSKRRDCPQDN